MTDRQGPLLTWPVRVVAAAASILLLLTAGMAALVQAMIVESYIGLSRDPFAFALAAGRATAGPLLGCLALGTCAVWGLLVAIRPGARLRASGWLAAAVATVATTGVAGVLVHEVWLYGMGAGRATHLVGRAPVPVGVLVLVALGAWFWLLRMGGAEEAKSPRRGR
ncbi:hypothetical protein [Gephyromycinifex aptenodytis]|uniref:hypothetical protein n=1 Tax=Gephyromycinifex aptenodytis TaxID=2716227 RepID=UPI001445E569|nr:hypothetical protein [Gephyromycinifex aptenodytis]